MDDFDVAAVRRRVAAATPAPWIVVNDSRGTHIEIPNRGPDTRVYIRRDREPADERDIEFIAHARSDVPFLLDLLLGTGMSDNAEKRLVEIETRASLATPGPWRAYLESLGGLGGCSMISVESDDYSKDMYVWLGSAIASDADIDFIANARRDVPDLVKQLRKQSI